MPKDNFKLDFFLHQEPDTGGGRSPRLDLRNRIRTMAYDCPSCPHILMGCLRGRKAAAGGGNPQDTWMLCPLAEREGNNRRNR